MKGAKSSAIIYSIVETAVANGRNPAKYLEFLLTEVAYLEKTPSAEDLESLMPWNVRFEDDCRTGDCGAITLQLTATKTGSINDAACGKECLSKFL